jgi:hypothetical protein
MLRSLVLAARTASADKAMLMNFFGEDLRREQGHTRLLLILNSF